MIFKNRVMGWMMIERAMLPQLRSVDDLFECESRVNGGDVCVVQVNGQGCYIWEKAKLRQQRLGVGGGHG